MVAVVMGCAAFALAFVLVQFGARRVYGYALTPSALEVRAFGRIAVLRIPLDSVAGVGIWRPSLSDLTAIGTLRLGNRIVGRAVAITRRGGFPRRIIITPDDPAAFVTALRTRAGAQ